MLDYPLNIRISNVNLSKETGWLSDQSVELVIWRT